ncbi:MAG: hydrogenase maturation nickel metallochaperone HypA [Solirubrobacteraceae bacterium]
MHELSLSRSILDAALTHADGRTVVGVDVTVGALRQVVPSSLSFYFEIVSSGTICEGAQLRAHVAQARLRCACGHEWELREPTFRCPRCAGAETTVLSGDELTVDSIEVEDEPDGAHEQAEPGTAGECERAEEETCTAAR